MGTEGATAAAAARRCFVVVCPNTPTNFDCWSPVFFSDEGEKQNEVWREASFLDRLFVFPPFVFLSFFLYFCRSALIHITLPLVLPPTRTGRPVTSEEERCHRTWTTKVQVKWQAKTTTTTAAAAAADVTAAATTTAIQYVFLGFFGRERIFDELCAPLQRTDPGQPSVQLEVADDAGLASSRWSLLWPHRALKKKNFSVVGWEPASSQRRLRLRGRACTTTIFSCARKGMEEGSGNAPTNYVRRRESKRE